MIRFGNNHSCNVFPISVPLYFENLHRKSTYYAEGTEHFWAEDYMILKQPLPENVLHFEINILSQEHCWLHLCSSKSPSIVVKQQG